MASFVTPKRGVAFRCYVMLRDQSNTKLFKANPTIAAGDFKVSKDGGAFANLTTLPSAAPASGRAVQIDLDATEMTADNVVVQCVDAAGAEWCDLTILIQTSARQIDDLAYPATSGRSMVVDASGLVDANTVKVGPSGSGTAQTARDVGASVLLSPGTGTGQVDLSSGKVLLQATQTGVTIPTVTTLTNDPSGVTTLLSRVPSGLFTGITSLAEWLGLIAGKQTGNATARTELRATGAGSGTFDETTDSQEATRDNMGTAQTGDAYARLGAPAGASVSADVAAVKVDTASILSKLLKYVQLIVRKDSAIATDNATEVTAINANGGSGAGGFANTTDSTEAIRDRGDSAWITATGFSTHSAADVWAAATRTLTAFDSSFKTGYALSSAGVQAIWDALTSALSTASSIGKLLVDNVNATISSRLASASYTAPLDAAGTRTAVGLASANLDTQLDALPTAAENADAVWDEATSGHTTAGSYGDKFGAHLKGVLKVVIGSGSTTTSVVLNASTGIDGGAPSSTDDYYNGRVLIFTSGALAGQATSISDYVGSTVTLTVVALTGSPASGVTAVIV